MPPLSPIHHTFAPHVDLSYALRTIELLVQPWKWRQGKSTALLERRLEAAFHRHCTTFSTGRQAFLALLQSLHIGKGDEVILPAFTCVVLPNAILARNATPIYCDIDKNTLCIDASKCKKLINSRTKAIVCQHTFGIPGPAKELKDLCATHNISLIEDCAHSLPDRDGPEEIGTHGDHLLLSFGRDKAISGVSGGAILTNHANVNRSLTKQQDEAEPLTLCSVAKLLLYPLIYSLAKPIYGSGIGRGFLYLCKKLKLLVPITSSKEKQGSMNKELNTLPNALATLTMYSFERLHHHNQHRRNLLLYYFNHLSMYQLSVPKSIDAGWPLQKLPLYSKNAQQTTSELKSENIHLHDGWSGGVITPPSVDTTSVGYRNGSCPVAEKASRELLSLPLHPTMPESQAGVLVDRLA